MNAHDIIRRVAEAHGVTVKDMRFGGRHRLHAWPRHEALWLVRQSSGLSFPLIGRLFGGRNHTTVMAACQRIEARFESVPGYREELLAMLEAPAAAEAEGGVKVVYIAGPFRAATPWLIEQNVRRAEEVALEVWRMGAAAICPHMNTRHFQDCAPDAVWIEGTLELLRRCDAVLVQGDWQKSSGTRGEIDEVRRLGKPVFFDATRLAWWLEEQRSVP